jgi:Rha family phage regulatory protein
MKELIPMDEHGLFCDTKDMARVDSRYVAKEFGKRHGDVLRTIENLSAPESGLTPEFTQRNFAFSAYKDSTGRKLPCYALTRDGFTMLVMGFTGRKAMQFKEAYIRRFNEMDAFIKTLAAARQEFPLLTENIKLLYDEPKPYHYSNECDMLNRLVLGQTAKQFRDAHDLKNGESIRPYLTPEQIELLDIVQKIDVGLLVSVPDFQMRKRHLEWYLDRRKAA